MNVRMFPALSVGRRRRHSVTVGLFSYVGIVLKGLREGAHDLLPFQARRRPIYPPSGIVRLNSILPAGASARDGTPLFLLRISPTRSARFDAENDLYSFALTVPSGVRLFRRKCNSGHVLAGHTFALEHEILAEGRCGRLISGLRSAVQDLPRGPERGDRRPDESASGPCSLDRARCPCSSVTSPQTCVLVRARSSALGPGRTAMSRRLRIGANIDNGAMARPNAI